MRALTHAFIAELIIYRVIVNDNMDKLRYIEGLAWDCVAAGQRPPLHPTTCAVLRLVALVGACRFALMCEVVPCSEDALRQQVSRLVRAGVLVKERQADGHGLYRLSGGGVRMVLQWEREHARVLAKLKGLE